VDGRDESRAERRHGGSVSKSQDQETRTPWEKDRDKILYSDAFRRLAGVTQTGASSELPLLHNRLTHSVKVAQLALRMAEGITRSSGASLLFDLTPDVAEAGGLAHDLGHPPFGHSTEHALDELAMAFGGFEGNAQSLRAVTKLTLKDGNDGLDLTRATLNATLKYPLIGPGPRSPGTDWRNDQDYDTFRRTVIEGDWTRRHYGKKWGAYPTEQADFDFARQGATSFERCPEAILIDWADDVSYAVHDIQDFFKVGMIPLDRLEPDDRKLSSGLTARMSNVPSFDHHKMNDALEAVLSRLKGVPSYEDGRADTDHLSRLASTLISRYERAVEVLKHPPYLKISEEAQYEVEILKHLTWEYVIERPQLAASQLGQERIVRVCFLNLVRWLSVDPANGRLPKRLRDYHALAKKEADTAGLVEQSTAAVKETKSRLGSERHPSSWISEMRESEVELVLPCVRAVVDFISGLTEQQLIDLYRRVSGEGERSIFGAWFA
jgi:dGTPase